MHKKFWTYCSDKGVSVPLVLEGYHMRRKGCILGLLLIGMVGLMGCGEGSETQMKPIDQKILFIYRDYIFGENGARNTGYFIDNQGKRRDYDFSAGRSAYMDLDKVYKYLLDFNNSKEMSIPVLSPEELQECYDCLYRIDMDNPLKVKVPEKNGLWYTGWYGVLENGEEAPQFVVLSESGVGPWKRVNPDEYAERILKLLDD